MRIKTVSTLHPDVVYFLIHQYAQDIEYVGLGNNTYEADEPVKISHSDSFNMGA